MRDVVVVDTSIALKWVLVEPDSASARELLDEWNSKGITIIAPTLLAYEVANALYQQVRKGSVLFERARTAVDDVLSQALVLDFTPGPELSKRAMELAQRFRLSATYDAHYLALAEREACDYWTADERLWNGVQQELAWVRWLGSYRSPGA